MGDDRRRTARQSDYHHARVGVAVALVAAVLIIIVVDAFSPEYEASPIVVAALLGTIGALVGVELRSDWRKP